MKIGVTGGAGYIGSHVVLALLEQGHQVLVIDDLSSGSMKNVFSEESSYTFIQEDFSSRKGLKALFDFLPDVIFHFAAQKAAGISMQYPEHFSKHNIRSTLKLIEALSQSECRNFVFSSSAAVYGKPEYLPLDENHPLRPLNYYGFTKQCIEENLKWFSRLGKMRFASLRYFNAAGYNINNRIQGIEKDANNLLPVIMETAIGKRPILDIFGTDYDTKDGTCLRDYIHTDDLAKAHLLSMEYILKEGKDLFINLGGAKGASVLEVLQLTEEVIGKKIPHRFVGRREGDPPVLIASSEKAYKILGWKAEHSSLKEVIESTWKVYFASL